MGIDLQKNALPTLFHFVRVRGLHQPHVFKETQILLVNPFKVFDKKFLNKYPQPFLKMNKYSPLKNVQVMPGENDTFAFIW